MANIDYNAIAHNIKTVLENSGDLPADAIIAVNRAIAFDQSKPHLFIFVRDRVAPPDQQPIAAGKETRLYVVYEVWCYGFSIVSVDDAADKRDDIIGKAEVALMSDRQLNNSTGVHSSWLDGGQFDVPQGDEAQWWMGGSVRLIVDVSSIT